MAEAGMGNATLRKRITILRSMQMSAFAEFPRSHTFLSTKIAGDVLRTIKTQLIGYLGNGVTGVDKQLSDPLHPAPPDLGEDRPVQNSAESFLKGTT